ncbi:hypothetical protein VHEMI02762 [[Torrubiella] hemipterigena]|uniref:Peptidase M3A/M3B catalytic domain-containing protein n=1 Tax=[Torrubiella] hemipterigena TaxID=1531966 RepID=A0A0A1SQN6_9HYPO|nr:hypothetical protein VHEMI02762 [[Torrubiella] hemipterigena]
MCGPCKKKTMLLTHCSDWGHGDANFDHLMSGYAATYYSYLWSKAFAVDMFESIFRDDPLNGSHGRRYRRLVLEPGGSRGALEGVTELLGREPSVDAFCSYLGIHK